MPATAEKEAAWAAAATKNRRPGKYTADAAMDFALANFSKLTGEAGSRVNAEGRTGRINEPTKRGGAALAFVRALDDFYGLSRVRPTRTALRESAVPVKLRS